MAKLIPDLSSRSIEGSDASLSEYDRCLHFSNVLDTHVAQSLRSALKSLDTWNRHYALRTIGDGVDDVDEATFVAAPDSTRFGSHLRLSPCPSLVMSPRLLPHEKLILAEFLRDIIYGTELTSQLEKHMSVGPIHVNSCEFAMYERGDYLAPHSDTHDSRLAGVNLYLDGSNEVAGGRLGYTCRGQTALHDCEPNSLTVIPIGDDKLHWVERFNETGPGRLTISMSIAGLHSGVQR